MSRTAIAFLKLFFPIGAFTALNLRELGHKLGIAIDERQNGPPLDIKPQTLIPPIPR